MAAVIPTTIQSTTAGFQPAFQFVSTDGDRHCDALAVIASITGKSLNEIFRRAETLGMPKTGPYSHRVDSDLISGLLTIFGWTSTEWKEVTAMTHLPALSICLVEYDSDWEVGRYVLVHSAAQCSHDAKTISYLIDPSATEAKWQIRTDLKALGPAWYIGIHPTKSSSAPAKQ